MLILGWRRRTSVEETGSFDCPVCRAHQPHVVGRTRAWFTLFFLPIFPVGSGSWNLVCGGCQSIFDPHQIHRDPGQAIMASSFQPRSTAGLSVVSLVFGILSPIFLLACFSSLFTSLIAIITGHLALSNIKHSQGRLEGRGLALTGLGFGYLMLLLTIGAITLFFSIDTPQPSSPAYAGRQSSNSAAQARLDNAESMVASDSRGQIAFGNSKTAEAIAADFANSMKAINEQAFTRSRKPVFELSGGNFLTYCELHEDSCVLIVHVPSYRKYEDDAKEILAELAWTLAESHVSDHLNHDDKLAVALRGTLLYGDIMIGTYSENESNEPHYRLGKTQDLLAFFPAEEIAIEPLAPTPEITTPEITTPEITTPEITTREIATPEITTPDPGAVSAARSESRPALPARSRPPEPAFENQISTTLVATIEAPGWNIQSLAFIDDNRRLAAGRLDTTVAVFDIQSREKLYQSDRLDQLGQIVSLDVARDGKRLLLGGYQGATAVMQVDSSGHLKHLEPLYRHDREASCLVASPIYDFMLSGGRNGTLAWQPYDGRSGNTRTLQELDKAVLAAYLPTEGSVALATDGRRLIRFSLQDGRVIAQHDLHNGVPRAAAFHSDGSHLVVSYGHEVLEYETENASLRQAYESPRRGVQWSVALHPNQPWLLTGGQGSVTVWDRETAQRLAVLDSGVRLYIQTIELTDDGKQLAMVPAAAGQSIKIFEFLKP